MTTYSFIDESGETRLVGTISPAPGGGSPPITSPLDVAGCALWFDASQLALANNAAVSTWPDLSTNGFDAVQTTPASRPVCKTAGLNGLRVVRFDQSGDPQYLDIPEALGITNAAPGATVAAVVHDYIGMGGSEGCPFGVVVGDLESANKRMTLYFDTTSALVDFGASTDDGVSNSSIVGGGMVLGSFVTGGSFGYIGAFGGNVGALEASVPLRDASGAGTAPSGSFPATDATGVQLGAAGDTFNGAYFDIGEVAVWTRGLTASERRQVLEYLSTKWATL